MGFGAKLRELRGSKTKEEVANAIDVTYSSYSKYEREERIPRDEVKMRIAAYYNTTVQSIFFAGSEHK